MAVLLQTNRIVKNGEIKLHLAYVLRFELTDLQFKRNQSTQATMIEQKIDEELAISNLKLELAPNEGEQVLHLSKERFDSSCERPLQLALTVFILQFEESEGVFVFYCELAWTETDDSSMAAKFA